MRITYALHLPYSRQDSIDNITVILRTSITGLLMEMGEKKPSADN